MEMGLQQFQSIQIFPSSQALIADSFKFVWQGRILMSLNNIQSCPFSVAGVR